MLGLARGETAVLKIPKDSKTLHHAILCVWFLRKLNASGTRAQEGMLGMVLWDLHVRDSFLTSHVKVCLALIFYSFLTSVLSPAPSSSPPSLSLSVCLSFSRTRSNVLHLAFKSAVNYTDRIFLGSQALSDLTIPSPFPDVRLSRVA